MAEGEGTQKDFELLQSTATILDGQRLPTPDRRAVIELSDAPLVKHQLRRQQQLLTDIAQRAREQEITELSGALTKRCVLDEFDRKYERPVSESQTMRKYTTNSSLITNPKAGGELGVQGIMLTGIGEEVEGTIESKPAKTLLSIQTRPGFIRSTTFFPKRKLRKTQRAPAKWKSLPRLQISYAKGQLPTANGLTQHQHTLKTNLIRSRNINGPIQLKHYIEQKDPLAPLILPNINPADSPRDLDHEDSSFIQLSRLPMKHQHARPEYDDFLVSKSPLLQNRGIPTDLDSKVVGGSGASRGDMDGEWVTQSMATVSIAQSTSPTPQTARAQTVHSRTSLA